jgi:DNA-binding NtrC family response regulator
MSIEPIHSVPSFADRSADRSADRPLDPSEQRGEGLGREFQQFLSEKVPTSADEPLSLRAWLDLAEAWKIMRTLRECGGNRSATARALGIGRRTLYAKMDKLKITPTWAANP